MEPDATPCRAIGQHCAAHKLNLAASQAGNTFKSFKSILKKLHELYSRSAVRTKGLEVVQKLLVESLDASGKVTNPSETRWLALGDCTLALKQVLPSVLISLDRESEERGDVVAAGLYVQMTKYKFIATLMLLCETLPTINRLSANFQESKVDFEMVGCVLEGPIRSLKAKKAELVDETIIETLKKDNIDISVTDDERQEFHTSIKCRFINQIIENMHDRFTHNEVMSAFVVFFECSNYTDPKTETQKLLSGSFSKLAGQFGLNEAEGLKELTDFVHYAQAGVLKGQTVLQS